MMETESSEWILLGASRGLGADFRSIVQEKNATVSCFSRKEPGSEFDANKIDSWESSVAKFKNLKPHRIVYFSGGGPHGRFQDKNWTDHVWAWNVNFKFPAYLLHHILAHRADWTQLQQICFIGSSVAEQWPDPLAASYAAGKHALRGLISSLQSELGAHDQNLDLRLFSPGYMDTSLLPANAWPRQESGRVRNPREIAQKLWDWLQSTEEKLKHKILL